MSIITCCFSLLDSLKHLSGVPAVTMPLLTAFGKACFIFRFSPLWNLSSFLVNTVISNLWYCSKSEESKQKKKKMFVGLSVTFENSHKQGENSMELKGKYLCTKPCLPLSHSRWSVLHNPLVMWPSPCTGAENESNVMWTTSRPGPQNHLWHC